MSQPTFWKVTNWVLQPPTWVGRNKTKLAKEGHKKCQLIPQKIFLQNHFYTGWAKKYFLEKWRLIHLGGNYVYIYRKTVIFENIVGKRRNFPISWYIYIYGVRFVGLGARVKRMRWWFFNLFNQNVICGEKLQVVMYRSTRLNPFL